MKYYGKSLSFRVATLFVVGSIIVMTLSIIVTLGLFLAMMPEEKSRIGPHTIASALDAAITHDAAGRMHIADDITNSTLLALAKQRQSFWYLVTNGKQELSYGPIRRHADPLFAGGAQEDIVHAEYIYAQDGQQMVGVRTASYNHIGTTVEVGGLVLSLPEAIWFVLVASLDGGLYPFLGAVLLATTTATVLILRSTIAGPVRRVVKSAERIDGLPNGRRLPSDFTPTELLPMVAAFNTALQRIDLAFDSQRHFLSNAAHELRTPLTKLRVKLEDVQDQELKKMLVLDTIRLSSIVTTLLQLARLSKQSLTMTTVDLVSIARAASSEYVPAAIQKNIDIRLEAPDTPVQVHGSELAIHTAITNLIANALRHASGTPTVTIHVADGGHVSVIDNGPGIQADEWADIMKPFVKGKDGSPDGIGLGLSIVCQVMDIHGGSIDLQQSPGGGATVTLVFPRQT